jgi:hypothetical protein
MNKKQYQILPLRTDIIPKYIDIDTKVIIELSDIKDKLKYLNDINNLKHEVWDKYFNMNNKIFKDKGKYKFNYHKCPFPKEKMKDFFLLRIYQIQKIIY